MRDVTTNEHENELPLIYAASAVVVRFTAKGLAQPDFRFSYASPDELLERGAKDFAEAYRRLKAQLDELHIPLVGQSE